MIRLVPIVLLSEPAKEELNRAIKFLAWEANTTSKELVLMALLDKFPDLEEFIRPELKLMHKSRKKVTSA